MKIEHFLSRVKNRARHLVSPVVRLFARAHFSPNVLTTLSLILIAIAAIEFGRGSLRIAGIWYLFGGLFDVFDGALARASNRVTKFGALFDSTLDRYSELLVFLGIGYYFMGSPQFHEQFQLLIFVVIFIALSGSFMVSYVRARAEGLDYECSVGLLQRPERVVLLGVSALISELVLIAVLFLIAIFANVTAIQRIYFIWKQENSEKYDTFRADV